MKNTIRMHIEKLQKRREVVEARFEEYDDIDDMHELDHIDYTIDELKSLLKEVTE